MQIAPRDPDFENDAPVSDAERAENMANLIKPLSDLRIPVVPTESDISTVGHIVLSLILFELFQVTTPSLRTRPKSQRCNHVSARYCTDQPLVDDSRLVVVLSKNATAPNHSIESRLRVGCCTKVHFVRALRSLLPGNCLRLFHHSGIYEKMDDTFCQINTAGHTGVTRQVIQGFAVLAIS
jgi:hypothetical protein